MRAVLVLLSVVAIAPVDRSRIVATEATLHQLARAVVEFRRISGRRPTAEEGLDVLIHKPADWPVTVPWAPIIETDCVPRDAWGGKLTFVLDPELAEGFGIYSCGQDGVSSSSGNDKDDLNTWSKGRPWLAYYESPWRRVDLQSSAITLGFILLAIAAAVVLWKAARCKNRRA